jgi:hypothetical protein
MPRIICLSEGSFGSPQSDNTDNTGTIVRTVVVGDPSQWIFIQPRSWNGVGVIRVEDKVPSKLKNSRSRICILRVLKKNANKNLRRRNYTLDATLKVRKAC